MQTDLLLIGQTQVATWGSRRDSEAMAAVAAGLAGAMGARGVGRDRMRAVRALERRLVIGGGAIGLAAYAAAQAIL